MQKDIYPADVFTKKASAFYFMNRLEIERLVLTSYGAKDKPDFIKLFTDEAVMKYVDKGVLTAEQAEAFWRKLFEKLYPQDYKNMGGLYQRRFTLHRTRGHLSANDQKGRLGICLFSLPQRLG